MFICVSVVNLVIMVLPYTLQHCSTGGYFTRPDDARLVKESLLLFCGQVTLVTYHYMVKCMGVSLTRIPSWSYSYFCVCPRSLLGMVITLFDYLSLVTLIEIALGCVETRGRAMLIADYKW